MTLGIDEVGRGAWAGPLVFAGVILPDDCLFATELQDSKDLTSSKRGYLYSKIIEVSIWSYSMIDNAIIDEIGLTRSSEMACTLIVEDIFSRTLYTPIILDGNVNYLKNTFYGETVKVQPKADSQFPDVMAASILAKHLRDEFMKLKDFDYPGYGFDSHVGYGTKNHKESLDRLGISPIHRRSFKPIKTLYEYKTDR